MISLIYGGSGSGKSAFAEQRVMELASEQKYYIATMQVYGEEGLAKVKRHRKLRAGKGFVTLECPRNLEELDHAMLVEAAHGTTHAKKWTSAAESLNGTALLECVSNLTANEMFAPDGNCRSVEETVACVIDGIRHVAGLFEHLVIVSNNVFEDGIRYDAGTMAYLQALGRINQEIATMAEEVYEVVVGIAILQKTNDDVQKE